MKATNIYNEIKEQFPDLSYSELNEIVDSINEYYEELIEDDYDAYAIADLKN